jgi:drug/metabolite transporter (DMT)-like permease
MSLTLLALILFAAILHATWNFFAKRSGGGLTVLWIGALIATLATLPVAIVTQWGKPIPREGLVIGVVSGFVHCAYWWALARCTVTVPSAHVPIARERGGGPPSAPRVAA